MTISDTSGWLRAHARSNPSRVACIDRGRSITFGELDGRVDAVARSLEGAGVGYGSRVALGLENSVRFVAAYLGILRTGAVAVPLNPTAPPAALLETLHDVAPRAMVFASGVAASLSGFAGGPEERTASLEPGVTLLASAEEPDVDASPEPEGLAAIIYTSGTTGRPKGVALTQANMTAIADAGCGLLELGPQDRVGVVTPMFHLYGLREIDGALRAGATLVIPGTVYPARVLAALHDAGVTVVSGVPSGFRLVVERYADQLASWAGHLRYLALGTDAAEPELLSALGRALPRTGLMVTYGLTELSRACYRAVPQPDDRPGSVGRPYPGVELSVIDGDGSAVPAGGVGRVALRSDMVFPGYWRRPKDSAATLLPDGRLLAPDLGRLDDDGFLYLLGRVDDVVNTGGQKVGPDEVEQVLRRHPAVLEAAVTGVADPAGILGRILKAWVVPAVDPPPHPEEIVAHCARHLEPHKVPRLVEFCRRLPKSILGKTGRGLLDERPEVPSPSVVGGRGKRG